MIIMITPLLGDHKMAMMIKKDKEDTNDKLREHMHLKRMANASRRASASVSTRDALSSASCNCTYIASRGVSKMKLELC